MDIVAKHTEPDADGVRIAELDEMSYRHQLWEHRPLTDFWRVGRGVVRRLAPYGIDTMGKLARFSLQYEEVLYNLFGVNAELLIDHAWGWEPCTMEAIKNYHPDTHSFSSGQVLATPYDAPKARVVIREMADNMALKLVRRGLVTDQLVLTIGYGRNAPAHSQGTTGFDSPTASARTLMHAAALLFDKIVNPERPIRYLNISTGHVIPREAAPPVQLNLFDMEGESAAPPVRDVEKEQSMQQAILHIKEKFGKNAILRGLNFEEGATARERNQQIGGHKA
jgi:DNA polymerase V